MKTNNNFGLISKQLKDDCFVFYSSKHQKYIFINGQKPKINDIEKEILNHVKNEKKYLAKIPYRTIVINLTEQCNLRCLYCHRYKKEYNSMSTISKETLLMAMKRAREHSVKEKQKIVVQFHGGEPTLKLDLIEDVLEKMRAELKYLDLRIQTNATNVTDEFITFCKKYKIQVGVSIDGPPHLTNVVRKFKNGSSIFPTVERNIKIIKKELPKSYISCLCVISSVNVNKAEEVFDYLTKHQHINDVSFLPLYPDFSPCLNQADTRIIPKETEMIDFSKKIFDLWIRALKNGKRVCIPNFQIWFWNLAALNRGAILSNTCCGTGETMLFIDIDGKYYPCSPLSYSKNMAMGNVFSSAISEIPKRKIGKLFLQRNTSKIPYCKKCVFQGVCRGGCPANSYLHKKDINKIDPFCPYWEGIISHVFERITKEPEIIKLIPDYTIRF